MAGMRWLRRAVVGLAVALVVVEVVVGRNYLLHSVRLLGHAEPLWVGVAIIASAASMAQFARTQRRLLHAAGTPVPIHSMLRLAYEANAINITLPGGTAFSIAYAATRLRGLGATAAGAGFSLLASGLLSGVTFWMLALGYASLAGGAAGGWLLLALAVLSIALAVGLRRRPGSVGRVVQRGITRTAATLERRRHTRSAAAVRRFAGELAAVRPRGRDWAVATTFATLNWLTDLACLFLCCLAVSTDLSSPLVIVAAYLAGMTASSISVLPGGFGVIEVAMIVAFTAGGVPAMAAAPAVLLYRLISCVLVVVVGWLVWLLGRRVSVRRTGAKQVPGVC